MCQCISVCEGDVDLCVPRSYERTSWDVFAKSTPGIAFIREVVAPPSGQLVERVRCATKTNRRQQISGRMFSHLLSSTRTKL